MAQVVLGPVPSMARALVLLLVLAGPLSACAPAALPTSGTRTGQVLPAADMALAGLDALQRASSYLAAGQPVPAPAALPGLVLTAVGRPVSCVQLDGLAAGPVRATALGVTPGPCPEGPRAWRSAAEQTA